MNEHADVNIDRAASGASRRAAPAALVLGRSRHTVTVARSMARAGYHVILGREQRRRAADFSRHVKEIWEHPPVKEHQAFLSSLKRLATGRPDLSLVFPNGEDALACFAEHPDCVPARVAIVTAVPETIQLCLNKDRVCELLGELRIPFPETCTVSTLVELTARADHIGYPVVVKPPSSLHPFHPKAFICDSEREMMARLPRWPPEQSRLVLQRYVRGLRHGCDIMAVNGEITAYFQFKALRSDWHDGTGMTVSGFSTEANGAMYEYCRRLIKRLNYSGPAAIQMLMDDATGEINFLEINPRLDASCALAVACGYDFPAMAAIWAEERKRGAVVPHFAPRRYPAGVRVSWLTGDLDGLLLAVVEHQISARKALRWFFCALGAALRARVHLIFRPDDPLPALYQTMRVLRAVASAIRSDGAVQRPWIYLNPLRFLGRGRRHEAAGGTALSGRGLH